MFKGVFTALITPFSKGVADEDGFRRLVDWQIDEGVHGLVPCGTTGESPTLDHEEHKRLNELCVDATRRRVPVMAGCGSNSTAEAAELVSHAAGVRAEAALVVTPYYNKPTQEGLFKTFQSGGRCGGEFAYFHLRYTRALGGADGGRDRRPPGKRM